MQTKAYAFCDMHGGQMLFSQLLRHGVLLVCRECYELSGANMLKDEDAAAAKVSTHPRVTLADIEANISERYYLNGLVAVDAVMHVTGAVEGRSMFTAEHPLRNLSVCILVLKNGYTVIGHSASASPENFDAELGKKIAYENALRQIWPLMGYHLKQQLHDASAGAIK